MASATPNRRPSAARTGFVYLLTLIVIVVVSSLAVVMARGASLRLRAGQAEAARTACRQAALGMLRAVANDLGVSYATGSPRLVTVQPEGEQIGDCTVVLIGRDPSGATQRFDLVDEAGKISVNCLIDPHGLPVPQPVKDGLFNAIGALPKVPGDLAPTLRDWVDDDEVPDRNGGAERTDSTYAGANVPYAPRNAPIETIDELRLAHGVTDQLFFGEDVNGNGRLDPGEDADHDGKLTPGLRDLLTLEARDRANPPAGTPGFVNVRDRNGLRALFLKLFDKAREAELDAILQPIPANGILSRLHLLVTLELDDSEADAIWPYLSGPEGRLGLIDAWSCHEDVLVAAVGAPIAKTIIAARPTTRPAGPGWLANCLTAPEAAQVGFLLTSGSYQFSVDILAVRNDGSGWARIRALIDCSAGSALVLNVRPLETQGWPLPDATPEMIRRTRPGGDAATGSIASFLTSSRH
jgi:hypothetical protein